MKGCCVNLSLSLYVLCIFIWYFNIYICKPINTCRYDLTKTCVSAAKHPSVCSCLECEMPKTISFGRNVQGAKRPRVWAKCPHVWGESSRWQNVQGRNVHMYGANRPEGETSRRQNVQAGGETSRRWNIQLPEWAPPATWRNGGEGVVFVDNHY